MNVLEKSDVFELLKTKLKLAKASFRVVTHQSEGKSEKIAEIRGNELNQSAKAMLLTGKKNGGDRLYILAVLPANMKVNFKELTHSFALKSIRMATTEEVAEYTACVSGAVPPFSFNPNVQLVVDPRLLTYNQEREIVFNAGCLAQSIFMNTADYERIAKEDAAKFIEFGRI